ncbi:hypothetical protein GC194_07995 [bacterium]|nr:hypothetical protein [bacterium]
MKLKILTLTAVLALFACVFSCGKKEPDKSDTTLTVSTNKEYPQLGDTVTVSVKIVNTIADIASIKVEANAIDTNEASMTILNESATASGLTYDGTFQLIITKNLKVNQQIDVKVTTTDAQGNSFDKTASTTPAAKAYIARKDNVMYHQFSQSPGFYDLVETVERYRSDPGTTKDLMDRSEQDKSLSKSFEANKQTGTTFVDLGVDFDLKTLNSAMAAKQFTTRNPSTIVSVAVESKFLAKLRGGDEIALVHITEIDPNYGGATDLNKGKYVFDIYKFQ